MYSEAGRKGTVHAQVSINTRVGPKQWELVETMVFDESGKKVMRFEEFFDSKV